MKLLNKITNIYLIYILIFFILLIDKSGYRNILVFKWNIYVYVSIVYILTILIISAIKILNKSLSIKEFSFNKVYIFALMYIFLIIISTLLSPYKGYNLLVGSPRMQGLMVNILYITSFIIVALTYKFNKNILYIALLPSIVLGIIIIVQKIGFNSVMCGTDYCYSTIGNVDTVGLLYTMYITLSLTLFTFAKELNKLYLGISVISSLIVMMIINVTSMYVSLFIIMLLILPYVVLCSKYLNRYLCIILSLLSVILVFHIDKYLIILPIMIIVMCSMIIVSIKEYNIINKRNIKVSYICLIIFSIILVLGIYFIDIKQGFIHELHSIMRGNFDDSFGTYRMFLIKRTVKMININHILLGSGVDTYYLLFMNNYFNDLVSKGYVNINDSACNIYLTMLINIGILGLNSFIMFIISIFNLIRNNINTISMCLLITILSYLIQGLFNIEVVIVTPVFYVLLSLYISSLKIHKSIEKK